MNRVSNRMRWTDKGRRKGVGVKVRRNTRMLVQLGRIEQEGEEERYHTESNKETKERKCGGKARRRSTRYDKEETGKNTHAPLLASSPTQCTALASSHSHPTTISSPWRSARAAKIRKMRAWLAFPIHLPLPTSHVVLPHTHAVVPLPHPRPRPHPHIQTRAPPHSAGIRSAPISPLPPAARASSAISNGGPTASAPRHARRCWRGGVEGVSRWQDGIRRRRRAGMHADGGAPKTKGVCPCACGGGAGWSAETPRHRAAYARSWVTTSGKISLSMSTYCVQLSSRSSTVGRCGLASTVLARFSETETRSRAGVDLKEVQKRKREAVKRLRATKRKGRWDDERCKE
jgi:hypothetical protein